MVPPIRLALEYFVPWTNDAGYQVAIADGFYRDAGLDVRQVLADPLHGDALEHLGTEEVELAVFPTNRLFVRREAGQPLLGLAAVNHAAMETIQTVTGRGIERPRDLEGKRLALNPTPRGMAMIRTLVQADGGDPDRVEIVDSEYREVTVDDLERGLADAFFGGYWAWDAMFGALEQERRITWPVDTIGAPPYHSYLLGCTEAFAQREPETVRAFLAATERGFHAAAADPERTAALLERTIPFVERRYVERSLASGLPATWFHEGQWGVQREALHQPYADWLAEHGILRDAAIWREATTNELLPARQAS